MKKADLLNMKDLPATVNIVKKAKEDKGIKKRTNYGGGYTQYVYQFYFRAVVENEILKVAIFQRIKLNAGEKEPTYEIYIAREEKKFLTYEPETGRWLTAKIDMLNYDSGMNHTGNGGVYATEDTKKLINDYLGTEKKEARAAVLGYQYDIRKGQLSQKYRRETDEIDEVMNAVPPLPKDFEKWAEDYGLYGSRYIFYHAGKKVREGYCSHCKKIVPVEDPRRNVKGRCKCCKSQIIYKPWKGQNVIQDRMDVGILQKLTDDSGYILRRFNIKKYYKRQNDYKNTETYLYEGSRCLLNEKFRKEKEYEYGEYKQSREERWCYGVNHGYNNYHRGDKMVLYSRNINKLRRGTVLRYIPLEDMFRSMPGEKLEIAGIMHGCVIFQQTEYLIKAGLYKIAAKVANHTMEIERKAKNPWDMLWIKKEQFNMCREMNISPKELGALQEANRYGVGITKEQLHWIGEYTAIDIVREARNTTVHKMIRYFREKLDAETNKNAWRDYNDYVSACERMKYDMRSEDVIFPQNFKQAHDRTTEELAAREEEQQRKQELEKDAEYGKLLPEIESLYGYEDKDFTIVVPQSKADFRKEGRENNNCVGGMYFEKVLGQKSVIVFLRKKEEKGKAYCTIEMKADEMIQCRSRYNAQTPEEANNFIEKYKKTVKNRYRKIEREKMERERIAI